jgi:3-oxoadipate CoA-transferase beta subunit
MAARAAQDIPDGAYVNLGIGIPELVAQFVPEGREFIYHTENGLLGMGPPPTEEERDLDLMNAGKKYVTIIPGAAYFHHADSFSMIRGGHIDVCVLGTMQVAANGDIAAPCRLRQTEISPTGRQVHPMRSPRWVVPWIWCRA